MQTFVKSELQLPCFYSQVLWRTSRPQRPKEPIHHVESQRQLTVQVRSRTGREHRSKTGSHVHHT